MKRFFLSLLIFLVCVAAIAWLLYPTVANQLALRDDYAVRQKYLQRVQAMTSEEMAEMLEAAAAWNEELEYEAPGDVFSTTARANRTYQSRLNISDGAMAMLQIPRINVNLPVWHEGSGRSAQKDLVHLSVSSLPTGSTPSHVMLAGPGIQQAEGFLGDLKLTGARMLQDLDQVSPGDVMLMQLLGRTLVYQVDEVQTVTAEGLSHLDLTPAEDAELLTLVTNQGDRRLLVSSHRIPAEEAAAALNAQDQANSPGVPWSVLLLGSPVLLLGFFIMWIIERFRRHAYRLPVSAEDALKSE